jgi:hypothetical protein
MKLSKKCKMDIQQDLYEIVHQMDIVVDNQYNIQSDHHHYHKKIVAVFL